MTIEDNLRDRAKEIRGAFEPSSVTNEAVGGLLLDIINFFIDYGGSGGEGGKPDARYWSKEELIVLDQYLYVLKDKVKALYADSAGDSELFKGHKWEDNFDQPVRKSDPVQFDSVTSTDFESKLKGWIIDALGNAEFRDVLLRSFKSWNFAAGSLGAGVGMVNDDELQTDKLLVRKIMYVLEMMVQRMKFQGGIMVLSPAAGFKIHSVEVFETYYRVHCHPGDFNEFEVGDQARIQNFNGNDTKNLWSLVIARGDDYIDISRVDKDGDGVPAEGDEIVQLGNRTNTNRQDAVLLSAVNGEVGIFTYFGINSFDLSGKEGSWLGKHGGKQGAVIRGEVHVTAGSDGLDKFDEYENILTNIDESSASAKDDFAKEMGYESFQDMADKAVEKGGKLVVEGLLNANLIDVVTLAANDAFVNKLSAKILTADSITAKMIAVGGFTFEDHNIYGGSKFSEGAGVNIVSDDTERAFKAYKDASNFVSVFYNGDDDWGVKGVIDGNDEDPIFQFGSSNKIGPFKYNNNDLEATYTSGGQTWKLRLSADGLHLGRDEATQGGVAVHVGPGAGGVTDAVLFINGGNFWHQAGIFYASEIIARGILELKSHLRFNDGAYESALPYLWSYSSNGTIPTKNRRLVYVQGNTGGDNPCSLSTSDAIDGQVITIVNTSTSHRLNITGTAKGNHWILEGCCGTFRYLAGYELWYPERFSW